MIRQNQPMQPKPQEPLNIEPSSPAVINRICSSNRRWNKWLTIIIYVVFAVTGQSIARLLENFFYLHSNLHLNVGGNWTQPVAQLIGFPILLFPFLYLYFKKQHQLMITSNRWFYDYFTSSYFAIGVLMACQAGVSASGKLQVPFNVFTPIYTTQLLSTVISSAYRNKIKYNRWYFISLILAVFAGALTLSSSFPGESEKIYFLGIFYAFYAALVFSYLLSYIDEIFDVINDRKPSFAAVLEVLIFSSLVGTIASAVYIFTIGEQHNLKIEMDGFSKGKFTYVWTLVGQAVAWQVYWVGIVGLVFSVSMLFANVISVCTWPIVSFLVAFFQYTDDQYNVLNGTAVGIAALSVASYFYLILTDKRDGDDDKDTS